MKKNNYAALLALPTLALTTSLQAGSFEGYLTDSQGSIVRTPFGECIHTGFWNKSYAQPECDDILEVRSKYAVAVDMAEKAGKPIPAKPPEIIEMEEAKIEEPVLTADVKIGMPESADVASKEDSVTESQPEPAPEITKVTQIEVSDGDNLWDIASNEQVYGNSELWPLLLCANRTQIVDADLIYPGQQLSIPQENSAAAIAAAIQHANMRGEWELGEVEDSDLEYLAIHCAS